MILHLIIPFYSKQKVQYRGYEKEFQLDSDLIEILNISDSIPYRSVFVYKDSFKVISFKDKIHIEAIRQQERAANFGYVCEYHSIAESIFCHLN